MRIRLVTTDSAQVCRDCGGPIDKGSEARIMVPAFWEKIFTQRGYLCATPEVCEGNRGHWSSVDYEF